MISYHWHPPGPWSHDLPLPPQMRTPVLRIVVRGRTVWRGNPGPALLELVFEFSEETMHLWPAPDAVRQAVLFRQRDIEFITVVPDGAMYEVPHLAQRITNLAVNPTERAHEALCMAWIQRRMLAIHGRSTAARGPWGVGPDAANDELRRRLREHLLRFVLPGQHWGIVEQADEYGAKSVLADMLLSLPGVPREK